MIEEITWTKEYKLERYHKLNLTAEKGCVLFAGSSLMEMFPVEKFAHEDGLPVTVYNRGVGGFITDELICSRRYMHNRPCTEETIHKHRHERPQRCLQKHGADNVQLRFDT